MCNAPIYDYFKKSKEAIKFITTHACKEGARAGVRVTELVFVLGPDPSVSHPDPGQESGFEDQSVFLINAAQFSDYPLQISHLIMHTSDQ